MPRLPIRIHAIGHILGQFLAMMSVAMVLPLAFTLQAGADSPRPMTLRPLEGAPRYAGALQSAP